MGDAQIPLVAERQRSTLSIDVGSLSRQKLPRSTLGTGNRFIFNRIVEFVVLIRLVVYDLVRLGRVHGASILGIGLILPFTVAAIVLW